MNDRLQAGLAIAQKLGALEVSMDRIIAEYGDVMKTLAESRAAAGLSLTYAPEVFDLAVPIGTQLVAARSATAAFHNRLEAVRRHLRLDAVHAGPPDGKDPDFAVAHDRRASPRLVA